MATRVLMTKMGMNQEAGTIISWLKAEGEIVTEGEPLVEVETDKVVVQIPAPASGCLANISARPQQEVPVGEVIALILAPGESAPEEVVARGNGRNDPQPQRPAAAPAAPHGAGTRAPATGCAQPRRRVTPLARKLSVELGVTWEHLAGSGPGGAVVAADVRGAAASAPPPAPLHRPDGGAPGLEPARWYDVRGMRRTIAERMQSSARNVPHIAFTVRVDMRRTLSLCRRLRPSGEAQEDADAVRVGVTAVIARAVAHALQRQPRLNGHYLDERIAEYDTVHLGMAVALDDGLIVPVLRSVERKGLRAVQGELDDLVTRAREGGLQPRDVAGGTFTVSNLGMFGVEQFSAIINEPQIAILTVGAIAEVPAVVRGRVRPRPEAAMTVLADHRATDGAVCARFLAELKAVLEEPYLLLG